jgi:hypothetical protein
MFLRHDRQILCAVSLFFWWFTSGIGLARRLFELGFRRSPLYLRTPHRRGCSALRRLQLLDLNFTRRTNLSPVHILLQECVRQRIQRLVLAALRAKIVREAEKILLVDLIEDGAGQLYDDFCTKRNAAEFMQ